MKVTCVGITLGLLLSGCSTISTHKYDSAKSKSKPLEGLSYHLPKGYFSLFMVENGGVVEALLGGSLMVPDPNHHYVTEIIPALIADNNVKIKVGNTNLLESATSDSTGKAEQILTGAVKNYFGLQSGNLGENNSKFYHSEYSWDEFKHAEKDANSFVARRIEQKCSDTFKKNSSDDYKADCNRLEALTPLAKNGNLIKIDVSPLKQDASLAAIASGGLVNGPKCPSNALCYHPLTPVKVSLSVAGVVKDSDIILIPDKTKMAYISLRSGVFAKQEYNLAFTNGVLTSYGHNSQSELVGLVGLPVKVVTAVITAPLSVLAERGKALSAEDTYQKAVIANIQQQDATRKFCNDNPDSCPDSLYRLIGGNSPRIQPEKVEAGQDASSGGLGSGFGIPGKPTGQQ